MHSTQAHVSYMSTAALRGRLRCLFLTAVATCCWLLLLCWRCQVDDPEQRRTVRQKRFGGYGENFRYVQQLLLR